MRMLDLFSGIGGFHKGFEQAGYEFDWVGFSEIDKYASAVYRHRFPEAVELGDIKLIQPGDLPKIDLITFGSPCQDFSIAGKRAGAKEGTRSSLVWQAIRLITECKPRFFVWENVKGTFSSNSGADFWAIIQAFTNIGGYRLEWQLINTRWFLPQNRERIYLVGYIGDRSGSKVFPIGETSSLTNNIANTLQHSGGNYRGMSMVQTFTERSFDGNREDGGRAIRYHKKPGETPCLSSQMGMGGNNVPMFQVQPVLTPNRAEKRQSGRRFKEDGEDMFTLTGQDQHGVMVNEPKILDDYNSRIRCDGNTPTLTGNCGSKAKRNGIKIINTSSIRRLTPVETCRLQGFPDDWNEYGEFDGEVKPMSDTQRYKQCGNAVTVNVVQAVAERLKINIRMRQNG
jgi:DNA (cytosine-5)-methyltransferase 1